MNTRRRVVVTAVAATVSVLAAATGSASGQVTLQYRWNQGEGVRYRFVLQTTATVDGLPDGSSRAVESNMSQVGRTMVDDAAADGTATFDVTNGRLLHSVTRTTMSMEMSMPLPDGNVMNVQSEAKSSTSLELLQP
jgi:hypothetical protein